MSIRIKNAKFVIFDKKLQICKNAIVEKLSKMSCWPPNIHNHQKLVWIDWIKVFNTHSIHFITDHQVVWKNEHFMNGKTYFLERIYFVWLCTCKLVQKNDAHVNLYAYVTFHLQFIWLNFIEFQGSNSKFFDCGFETLILRVWSQEMTITCNFTVGNWCPFLKCK